MGAYPFTIGPTMFFSMSDEISKCYNKIFYVVGRVHFYPVNVSRRLISHDFLASECRFMKMLAYSVTRECSMVPGYQTHYSEPLNTPFHGCGVSFSVPWAPPQRPAREAITNHYAARLHSHNLPYSTKQLEEHKEHKVETEVCKRSNHLQPTVTANAPCSIYWNSPGPFAPPGTIRPRRKMTARSYSCTTCIYSLQFTCITFNYKIWQCTTYVTGKWLVARLVYS